MSSEQEPLTASQEKLVASYGSTQGSQPEQQHGDDKCKYAPGEYRLKVCQSVLLYYGVLVMGVTGAMIGPTILDLQLTAHATTSSISYVFTGRAVGGMVGAVLGGILIDRLNRWLLMAACQLAAGTMFVFIPWIPNIAGLVLYIVVYAIPSLAHDTASNMSVLAVWQEDNGPWMQAFHCFFALGGLLAPLIARPFLLPDESLTPNITDVNQVWSHMLALVDRPTAEPPWQLNSTSEPNTPSVERASEIWICYLIAGCLVLVAALLYFIMFLICRTDDKTNKTSDKQTSSNKQSDQPKFFVYSMALGTWIFCFFYCVLEITSQSYIFSYTVEYLELGKDTAAIMNAAFWLGFMCGRVAGIGIIRCVPSKVILIVSSLVICASLLALVFLADLHPSVVWVCILVWSFAEGPIFAAALTWLQQYIDVTGTVGSGFMIAGSLGDGIGPIILGSLAAQYGYITFGYMMLVDSFISLVTFLLLQTYAWTSRPKVDDIVCEVKH